MGIILRNINLCSTTEQQQQQQQQLLFQSQNLKKKSHLMMNNKCFAVSKSNSKSQHQLTKDHNLLSVSLRFSSNIPFYESPGVSCVFLFFFLLGFDFFFVIIMSFFIESFFWWVFGRQIQIGQRNISRKKSAAQSCRFQFLFYNVKFFCLRKFLGEGEGF